jgi:uncharacterized protein (TIGR01777 family)
MRVAITGATGFVGTHLVRKLEERNIDYLVVSRDAAKASRTFARAQGILEWDPPRAGPDPKRLDGLDAVVHLAGATIAQRWTARAKRDIFDSRIASTRLLVKALEETDTPPPTLVSHSAIGFYGPRDDTALTEEASAGDDFLADLCRAWEEEASRASRLGVRVVTPRVGIVLGQGGGALPLMLTPFRLGLGGPIGSGRQWMSWIHIEDVVELIQHAIRTPDVQGPMNATAPNPVRNSTFSKTLGRVLHRPAILPTPIFGLKLLYGEFASVLATGQRVLPERALATGYDFRFPDLEEALASAVRSP